MSEHKNHSIKNKSDDIRKGTDNRAEDQEDEPVSSTGIVRRHIFFYGRVQGVGFRYTAYSIARSAGLTGWIRNVNDFVEMEIQGSPDQIDCMINELNQNSWIRISHIQTREIPVQKDERRFQVTY